MEKQIVELFEIFRENDIEPILLKGWAAGLYYPAQYERVFSDIDLAVPPKDFEKATNLARDLKLTVDLHEGFRKLDSLPWERVFENSVVANIDGYNIRVLCPEDHLRVLCVHWLFDGGIYKEKLRDIFYLIEKNAEDFDWDKCLNVVDSKRRNWIIVTIALVYKYFGLNVDRLPFNDKLRDIPRWIIKTVEREWKQPVPLRPLHTCLNDRQLFFEQLKKRIPPNMIQATVELDGEFNDGSRLKIQILNIFYRIQPSLKRIVRTMLTGEKY
ncbi:MAG: nucleotidyltransferase family protein [Pyrinomonadaceae bacterium]|nr:nucleotidyltransferase family protein [Pyrinomonadaceae bacterium]